MATPMAVIWGVLLMNTTGRNMIALYCYLLFLDSALLMMSPRFFWRGARNTMIRSSTAMRLTSCLSWLSLAHHDSPVCAPRALPGHMSSPSACVAAQQADEAL